MKKLISALILGTFILAFATTAYAQEAENVENTQISSEVTQLSEENTQIIPEEKEISVVIDGKALEFDVKPRLINDRTMVPMRKIFESLGAEVEWYEPTQAIIATKGSCIIIMQIDKYVISTFDVITNESKTIELDVPPMLVEDRTLVPVRAISETLGYNVEWVEETGAVIISKNVPLNDVEKVDATETDTTTEIAETEATENTETEGDGTVNDNSNEESK